MDKSLDKVLPLDDELVKSLLKLPIFTQELLNVLRAERGEKLKHDVESTPELAEGMGVPLAQFDQAAAGARDNLRQMAIERLQDSVEYERNLFAERIARILAKKTTLSGISVPKDIRNAFAKLETTPEAQKDALLKVLENMSLFVVSDYMKKIVKIDDIFDLQTLLNSGHNPFEIQDRISRLQSLLMGQMLVGILEEEPQRHSKPLEKESNEKHILRISSTTPDSPLSGAASTLDDVETDKVKELVIADKSILNDEDLQNAIERFPNVEILIFENTDTRWKFKEIVKILRLLKNPKTLQTLKLPNSTEIPWTDIKLLESENWKHITVLGGSFVVNQYPGKKWVDIDSVTSEQRPIIGELNRFLPIMLEIHKCLVGEFIKSIARMRSVQDVIIYASGNLDNGFFETLAKMPYLKSLTVHQVCYYPESLSNLENSRLQSLSFNDPSLNDEDLSAIKSFKIQFLYFGDTNELTHEGLKNIPETVKDLTISECKNFGDNEFATICQRDLEKLRIEDMTISSTQLHIIAKMKSLKTLALYQTKGFRDEDLEAFRRNRPDVELIIS